MDQFYKYSSAPQTAWMATESEAYAPMTSMEFRDEPIRGGSSLAGFYFYFADNTELFISPNTIFADYNPDEPDLHTSWSIVFPVSGGAINTAGTITYDSEAALYDGNASTSTPQTFYRLPVIRGVDFGDGLEPQTLSSGGVYRENIVCNSTLGPIVELIKIS